MFKWYILHTASGSEGNVKKMIEEQIAKQEMFDSFDQIVVPTIEVPEIKRGKKVLSEKKIMPGYILIHMLMTDDSWHLVKSVPKITGFLGSKTTPHALSASDVQSVFSQIETASQNANKVSLYNVGDKVEVSDGPFDGFTGVVDEVSLEVERLKVCVSIFGKSTPIELKFTQVTKVTE